MQAQALGSILILALLLTAPPRDLPQQPLLGGPTTEPPLRARVQLGEERIDVVLGQSTSTVDGRPIVVELLPERSFRVEGAFSFSYPHGWRFLGSVGSPTPVDAWWTLGGEGMVIHLRRHGLGAREIGDLYAENMRKTGGSEPRPVALQLGDRVLEGHAVETTVGHIGPGESRRWVQEIYWWEEAEGVSWMMSVQRDIGPAHPNPGLTFPTDLVVNLYEPIELDETEPPQPTVTELDRALASFRWE